MIDYFAELGEARRPWLDESSLHARFLKLSAACHPDRVHGASTAERDSAQERFTALNAAYQCLRQPRSRVAHLLALEQGREPSRIVSVPADAMELFTRVGSECHATDRFLEERSKVESPILKVQLFERGMELSDRLMHLQKSLAEAQSQLEQELKDLNAAWESSSDSGSVDRATRLPLAELERIQQLLSYYSRWTEQLHERIARLSF